MTTLDEFTTVQTTGTHRLSDAEIDYLYETSYERMVEKRYDYLIAQKLVEERKLEENHKKYVNNNYIRVGGN